MKFSYRIILFLLIFFWTAGIFFEFFAEEFPLLLNFVPFVKKGYSLVCHQQPEKLVYIFNTESFVCSRCMGIYSGFLIFAFINIFFEIKFDPPFKLFLIGLIPALIDSVLVTLGIYHYSKAAAGFTGFLLGSSVFLYFYRSMIELIAEKRRITFEKIP